MHIAERVYDERNYHLAIDAALTHVRRVLERRCAQKLRLFKSIGDRHRVRIEDRQAGSRTGGRNWSSTGGKEY